MMTAAIRAVVFKTARLLATRRFFEDTLQFQIKESSARHFVIYSKNIRLVFVESPDDFEVEIYAGDKSHHFTGSLSSAWPGPAFKTVKDPNGISVIIT